MSHQEFNLILGPGTNQFVVVFLFYEIKYFNIVLDMHNHDMHDVVTIFHLKLHANSKTSESFFLKKNEERRSNNIQLPVHFLYFRKDFQITKGKIRMLHVAQD